MPTTETLAEDTDTWFEKYRKMNRDEMLAELVKLRAENAGLKAIKKMDDGFWDYMSDKYPDEVTDYQLAKE